jgi:hypothetical protein
LIKVEYTSPNGLSVLNKKITTYIVYNSSHYMT